MTSKWILFATLWVATLAAAYFVGLNANASVAFARDRSSDPLVPPAKDPAQYESTVAAAGAETSVEEASAKPEGKEASAFAALAAGDLSRAAWMRATLEAMNYDSAQLERALTQVFILPASGQRDQMIYELLARWGTLDPQQALAFAENIASLDMRNQGVGEVLEGWASVDPVSALNWLDQNGSQLPARIYGDYLEDIVDGYAQNNSAAAFQYVMALPEDLAADRRIKHGAMREVIDAMVEQDAINQALEMTLAMEESNMRNETLEEIVDEWAARDPLAAKAFVESMADDPAYGDLQRQLLSEWAEDDPEAAAEWLGSLDPETTDQARMATSLVANWTRYDMEAAANWLNSLPPTPELDRAVGIYSMRAAQDDPAAALTWANSVSNPQAREHLESRILPMLREQDNEAFEAYLADSDFSDDKKKQYREAEVHDGRRWGRWR